MLGGVITAYLDHAFVSLPAAADFAVSAGRCGCPASVSARLRRCSAARRSCAGHSHGGSTVHLQCWRSRSLELRCCDFVVLTYSGADPKRLNERLALAPEMGGGVSRLMMQEQKLGVVLSFARSSLVLICLLLHQYRE